MRLDDSSILLHWSIATSYISTLCLPMHFSAFIDFWHVVVVIRPSFIETVSQEKSSERDGEMISGEVILIPTQTHDTIILPHNTSVL